MCCERRCRRSRLGRAIGFTPHVSSRVEPTMGSIVAGPASRQVSETTAVRQVPVPATGRRQSYNDTSDTEQTRPPEAVHTLATSVGESWRASRGEAFSAPLPSDRDVVRSAAGRSEDVVTAGVDVVDDRDEVVRTRLRKPSDLSLPMQRQHHSTAAPLGDIAECAAGSHRALVRSSSSSSSSSGSGRSDSRSSFGSSPCSSSHAVGEPLSVQCIDANSPCATVVPSTGNATMPAQGLAAAKDGHSGSELGSTRRPGSVPLPPLLSPATSVSTLSPTGSACSSGTSASSRSSSPAQRQSIARRFNSKLPSPLRRAASSRAKQDGRSGPTEPDGTGPETSRHATPTTSVALRATGRRRATKHRSLRESSSPSPRHRATSAAVVSPSRGASRLGAVEPLILNNDSGLQPRRTTLVLCYPMETVVAPARQQRRSVMLDEVTHQVQRLGKASSPGATIPSGT